MNSEQRYYIAHICMWQLYYSLHDNYYRTRNTNWLKKLIWHEVINLHTSLEAPRVFSRKMECRMVVLNCVLPMTNIPLLSLSSLWTYKQTCQRQYTQRKESWYYTKSTRGQIMRIKDKRTYSFPPSRAGGQGFLCR